MGVVCSFLFVGADISMAPRDLNKRDCGKLFVVDIYIYIFFSPTHTYIYNHTHIYIYTRRFFFCIYVFNSSDLRRWYQKWAQDATWNLNIPAKERFFRVVF